MRYSIIFAFIVLGGAAARGQDVPAWHAGAASVVITPKESLWMAGYAARNKPSEGKAQELYAKALALKDADGNRVVIVTMDLIGIPRPLRDAVAAEAERKHQLPAAALLLNASHTHCGPVVRSGGSVLYDLGPEQSQRIEAYVADLQTKLVAVIGAALADLKPATLGYSRARAGFAMNRRLPSPKGPMNSPYPDGPVDHDVPVLRIAGADGKLRAVLFGYACHNTTLSFYQFCGDYAGYAQEYFEKDHPGVTALFIIGCGGDQNPYPRGTLEQAQQHGRALANAVEAALLPKPKPVQGPLRTALEEVELDFVPLGREELVQMKESKDKVERRRAEMLLAELDKTGKIHASYNYPVQIIQFGNELTLIGLAGEVVVDYALRLKRELTGNTVWIAGYTNDVFGYVPSVRVLKEGGYEGGGAMRFTRLPGPFAPSVEERIVGKVHALVKQVRKADRQPVQKTPRYPEHQDLSYYLEIVQPGKAMLPRNPLVGVWQADLMVGSDQKRPKEYVDLTQWVFMDQQMSQPVLGTMTTNGKLTWVGGITRYESKQYSLNIQKVPHEITCIRLLPFHVFKAVVSIENDKMIYFGGDSGKPRPKKLPDNLQTGRDYSLIHFKRVGKFDNDVEIKPIQKSADWLIRRQHVLSHMQEVMGELPDQEYRCPLDVKLIEEVKVGDLVRRKLTFQSEPGHRVPAYLFLPPVAKDRKTAAVLCLHQTTKLGKGEPAGLGGNPNLHYALHLAQRGFITLAPDYPSFGEHHWDFDAHPHYKSGSMKAVWDNIRAVDLLQTVAEIDPERIGVIGHSLGGHNAMFTAAFEPRLKAIVSSCGFTSFKYDDMPSWTGKVYMPRIAKVYGNDATKVPFDFPEVVASFAPRPFLACAALHDDDFDSVGVQNSLASASMIYALFGKQSNVARYYPDSKHDFPADARKVAYEFLERHLKATSRSPRQ